MRRNTNNNDNNNKSKACFSLLNSTKAPRFTKSQLCHFQKNVIISIVDYHVSWKESHEIMLFFFASRLPSVVVYTAGRLLRDRPCYTAHIWRCCIFYHYCCLIYSLTWGACKHQWHPKLKALHCLYQDAAQPIELAFALQFSSVISVSHEKWSTWHISWRPSQINDNLSGSECVGCLTPLLLNASRRSE